MSRVRFRGIDALRLADRAGNHRGGVRAEGRDAARLAGAFTADGELQLIDGYQCAAELNGQHGCKRTVGALQNRIGRALPLRRGRSISCPVPRGDARLIYHGLARTSTPALAYRRPRGRVGAVRLCEAIRPGASLPAIPCHLAAADGQSVGKRSVAVLGGPTSAARTRR